MILEPPIKKSIERTKKKSIEKPIRKIIRKRVSNVINDNVFLKKIIIKTAGEKVATFISDQVDLTRDKTILLLPFNDEFYDNNNIGVVRTIIDLKIVNHNENIKKYFRYVNNSLPDGGIYVGCVESHTERRRRLFVKYPRFIAPIISVSDFILHRVLPKLVLTKFLYDLFYKKKYNVISKAEILGRLSYAGFEIIGHEKINNLFYFSVIKTKEAVKEKDPNFGIIFKMNRIGENGKIIGVYKVRTMHAYSQYIQDYVVKLNGYNKSGKPYKDFRLTRWGRIIRKFHLDEIPQLLNVLKGELNIVGVRPLSKFGYQSLPEDLQKERIKYKPGCIPPNISLGITGFNQVILAEKIYLRQRKKYGIIINVKYFFMALYNLARRKTSSS